MGDEPPGLVRRPYGNDVVGHDDQEVVLLDGDTERQDEKYEVNQDYAGDYDEGDYEDDYGGDYEGDYDEEYEGEYDDDQESSEGDEEDYYDYDYEEKKSEDAVEEGIDDYDE